MRLEFNKKEIEMTNYDFLDLEKEIDKFNRSMMRHLFIREPWYVRLINWFRTR
jgi:hypothetical protein